MKSYADTASSSPANGWDERLRAAVGRYEATLLRSVGERLVRLQSKRPPGEVVEKIVESAANLVIIDRRLKELELPSRALLGMIGLSCRPQWRLGGLLELLSVFGPADGMAVVFQLFEAGLLYPVLADGRTKLKSFEEWLAQGNATGFLVFTHPNIADRALVQWMAQHEDADGAFSALQLETVVPVEDRREADGMEFFLRLGALWQQVRETPLKVTQQGEFFKRDHERLHSNPLLCEPAADALASYPGVGPLMVALGLEQGQLRRHENEIAAGDFPEYWTQGVIAGLRRLWGNASNLESWDAAAGWRGLNAHGSPYGSAAVLAIALLARLPADEWVVVESVAEWLAARHCYWRGAWSEERGAPSAESVAAGFSLRGLKPAATEERGAWSEERESLGADDALKQWTRAFLLGVAHQLRLVTAAKSHDGRRVVRLSTMGRAILGLAPVPPTAEMAKTLLVQPNLEMIAYRQGLSPELIANLSRFAVWKTIGPACTLQLSPESIYRGLEAGLTWEKLVQTLQRHNTRELPPGVLQSLRTWADKRERLTVYASATLMEFHTPADLQGAMHRGLPGVQVADTIALVADENAIEYRDFRLLGTRDYTLPPDRCVEVESDGVTLAVDIARADLRLDTELQRFARPLDGVERGVKSVERGAWDEERSTLHAPRSTLHAVRRYQITPDSLRQARAGGLHPHALEEWFQQRTGESMPAAARLLIPDPHAGPLIVRTQMVIETPSAALADGLMQWPETRKLIQTRLGPQALVVRKSDLAELQVRIAELELRLESEES